MPGPATPAETREQRFEALMKGLRPTIEARVRAIVERAVDVPEAEEFGAIDFTFRDDGQKLANDIRQANVSSRKNKGYVGCSVTCAYCQYAAKFHSYQQRRVLTVHGGMQVRRAYYYLHFPRKAHIKPPAG